nr:MAG TPA: hypothetical protein [Caudoviricetes sp.]
MGKDSIFTCSNFDASALTPLSAYRLLCIHNLARSGFNSSNIPDAVFTT